MTKLTIDDTELGELPIAEVPEGTSPEEARKIEAETEAEISKIITEHDELVKS